MRRKRGEKHQLDLLFQDLENLEEFAVFAPVVGKIRESAVFLKQARDGGFADGAALSSCASIHRRAIEKLPSGQHIGTRFLFDACLIQAIAAKWNTSDLGIPGMMYPNYGGSWSYRRVPLGPAQVARNPTVDVIGFRGSAIVDDIDLLDYPWLLHELGHSLLKTNETGFESRFTEALHDVIGRRNARSIALHGPARQRAHDVVASMADHWMPSHSANNWAHEIATDIIAVWCVGPAFMAAFFDQISSDDLDPFLVDKDHPPYATRASAIEEAGRRLGWSESADLLAGRVLKWTKNRPSYARTKANELTDPDLVQALVSLLIDILEQGRLPRCVVSDLDAAFTRFSNVGENDFGTELLLAAYAAHESLGEGEFAHWQDRVVAYLANQVTL